MPPIKAKVLLDLGIDLPGFLPTDDVFPLALCLQMGWNWAAEYAQAAHLYVVSKEPEFDPASLLLAGDG